MVILKLNQGLKDHQNKISIDWYLNRKLIKKYKIKTPKANNLTCKHKDYFPKCQINMKK